MSKPTIIMITHALEDQGMNRLNDSLVDLIGISGRMTRVDLFAPTWDAATAVHIGSFNHLDEPLFMQLVRDAGWQQKEPLQVFIEREDDEKTNEYDLFDDLQPRRLAQQAFGRGVGFPVPSTQSAFFDRFRNAGCDSHEAADAIGWIFEVVAVHPSYFLEADARAIPYGQGTALETSRFTVSPVDLACLEIGVRWGSRRTDVLDYADPAAEAAVKDLAPGDLIKVDGQLDVGPHGIAELFMVRSVVKLP